MGRHAVNRYPRETVEFQPVVVTIDGQVITAGVQFAITAGSERPTVWLDPVLIGGKAGLMIDGPAPGLYRVWARVTDAPEQPVIDCGTFVIT